MGIGTSYCKVPYGTAPDRTRSLLHAGIEAFTSMENIQEKNERRVQQGKKQHPQRLNRNSLLVQTPCRQIWGGVGGIIYKKMDAGGEMNSMKQDYNCGISGERKWRGLGSSPVNEFVP